MTKSRFHKFRAFLIRISQLLLDVPWHIVLFDGGWRFTSFFFVVFGDKSNLFAMITGE